VFAQILLEEAVRVLTPVLVAALVGLVAMGIKWLQNKIGDQRWSAIEQAVKFAVLAAEQSGFADDLISTGEQKKALAIGFAQQFLDDRKIKIDVGQLSALIESQVAEQINLNKVELVQVE
jgi:hypothetical protein